MRVNDNATSLRRVVLVTATVAALVFASLLLYNLSVANDWDCEEIAFFYPGSPRLASTLDSEQNLHLLFLGRTEEGVRGLVYALSAGDDFDVELVKEGISEDDCHYETLSIAVDSKGIVYAAAVYRNEDFVPVGLYAVRENGQWWTEIVAAPTYLKTLFMGIVVDSYDRANLFYYQASSKPQYYDPVFVWSTISEGVWSNKTVSTESRVYSWLYSACSDASGRVHFTSWLSDQSTNESGVAYTVYDGEHLNSTILPRLRGSAPLALDSCGRPFIGLIENTTGEARYSIASLQGDGWVLDPIGECVLTWGVDIPYVAIDDTDGIHAVITNNLSPDYTKGVVYASSVDGIWSTEEVDKVKWGASGWSASFVIGPDGVVRIFYSDDAEDALMMASSEKDTETLMQPYVNAGELTLIVTVALAAVWLMAVLITRRIRENKRRAEDFKKPFDFADRLSEEAPEERP